MPFYDGFMIVNNAPPSVKWRRHLQDTVDKQFENASTWWDDIYEEKEFGSDKIDQISNPEILEEVFNKIEARITSLIDAKSGQRDNDDYKQIIYKNTSYKPKYGQRYYFDNNIWIIYSTENIRLSSANAYIRRCNNVIGIKMEDGTTHKEPCSIDYKMTETQPTIGETIDVPNGRIEIQCQYNKYTDLLQINTRFILGRSVYKIRSFNDYNNVETFNDKTNYLLKFYADYDGTDYNDNIAEKRPTDFEFPTVPEYTIPINSEKEFTVGDGEYKFTVDTTIPESFYIFTTTKNSFTIYNLRQSAEPIVVKYNSDKDSGQITIHLGGVDG